MKLASALRPVDHRALVEHDVLLLGAWRAAGRPHVGDHGRGRLAWLIASFEAASGVLQAFAKRLPGHALGG